MADRCEKCGREFASIRGQDLTHCMGDWLCEFATEAYRRGLREGVEISKHGIAISIRLGTDWKLGTPVVMALPDWSDVDAELERRLK